MLYEYTCPCCGRHSEVWQGMKDEHVLGCECGTPMDRVWYAPVISVDGDFAHTNTNWGVEVRGKTHWQQEMAARGEVPFEQNPTMAVARKEAKYIKDHSPTKDREARAAANGIMSEAGKKERLRRIRNVIKGA